MIVLTSDMMPHHTKDSMKIYLSHCGNYDYVADHVLKQLG
jgi:hypothetical protein